MLDISNTLENEAFLLYFFLLFPAKKELSELRDLYFQVKDLIFQGRFRIVQNTWAMSNIAQNWFGAHQRMDSVRHPRYDTFCLSYLLGKFALSA